MFWILLVYLPLLGSLMPPLTGDQKVYLSIAQEMRVRGEWLQPYLFGEPNYLKPPFQYWVLNVGWDLFGLGAIGTLLPHVFALVIAGRALDRMLPEFLKKPTEGFGHSLRPSWVFAAMFATLTYALSPQMEIWILAFWLAAVEAATRAEREGSLRTWAMAWVWAGVLSLVKSPLYSVLFAAGVGLVTGVGLLSRVRGMGRKIGVALIPLLGAVIGASWYAGIYFHDPVVFKLIYWQQQSLEKLGGNGSTPTWLWRVFLLGCLPWAFFLPLALTRWPAIRRPALWLGWLVPIAGFFTYFPYRTETYLFPLAPLAAIFLVGLAHQRPKGARGVGRAALLLGLAAIGVLSYVVWSWGGGSSLQPLFALALASLALIMGWSGRWVALGKAFLLLVLAIRVVAIQVGDHDLAGLRAELARPGTEGARLAFYDPDRYWWHEIGYLAQLTGRPGVRAERWEEFRAAVQQGAIGVVDEEQEFPAEWKTQFELVPWKRWKRRAALNEAVREKLKGDRGGTPITLDRTLWLVRKRAT